MMDMISNVVSAVNSFLWDYALLFLLCGTGIYYTFRLRFVQVRKFIPGIKRLFGNFNMKGEKAGKDGMSSFQALTTAIAAQVGTG
ncbi:MAG: sodium:alanine symporter family protein, partial [Lachnospiraceae bacterium]|nr:sodium:alanine symporter family protein [Lachnospiraceae bacterium]